MENEERVKKLEIELQQIRSAYDDFVHLAAHDLQSPVRKITTLLERFIAKSASAIPEDAMTYLTRINKGLDQMTSLINDISTLSQITPNSGEWSHYNLNEIFDSLIIEENINEATLSIAAFPALTGNKEQIILLFKELIKNSIKFKNPDKPLEISVSFVNITNEEKNKMGLISNNKFINILFQDNGIGFNPEMADRIVKPFQRLHGNATYSGNGIGLAICKKITECHGGIFSAQGKENEGATFSVILPTTQN